MIRARYDTDGVRHSLTVTGHAGHGNRGEDIVCAGASAIVFALLGWLENNEEDLEWSDYDVHCGDVVAQCAGGERTAAAFDMAVIGLEQIAYKYPDHLQIEITGQAG